MNSHEINKIPVLYIVCYTYILQCHVIYVFNPPFNQTAKKTLQVVGGGTKEEDQPVMHICCKDAGMLLSLDQFTVLKNKPRLKFSHLLQSQRSSQSNFKVGGVRPGRPKG